MKNPTRKALGVLTMFICTLVATAVMYLCSYVFLIGDLRDEEMGLSLLLPIIMFIPTVIIYLCWFSSKAKKFTNGTYMDYRASYYQRPIFIILTIACQYIVGVLVTLPLFGFYIEVTVPMMLSLLFSELLLIIADILCYVVFCPIANEGN